MAEHQDPNKNIDRSMAPPMEPQDSWGMVSDRESYSPDEDYESDGPPWPMKVCIPPCRPCIFSRSELTCFS